MFIMKSKSTGAAQRTLSDVSANPKPGGGREKYDFLRLINDFNMFLHISLFSY